MTAGTAAEEHPGIQIDCIVVKMRDGTGAGEREWRANQKRWPQRLDVTLAHVVAPAGYGKGTWVDALSSAFKWVQSN